MDSVSAMQAWLTRAGLLLQFISLWLVTPQIIGEERLSSMVSDLGTQIARIRALLAISNTSRASYIASGLVGGIGGLGFSVAAAALYSWSFQQKWIVTVAIFLGGGIAGFMLLLLILTLLAALGKMVEWIARARSYLLLGAVMFTIGFVLLIAATFVHAAPQ